MPRPLASILFALGVFAHVTGRCAAAETVEESFIPNYTAGSLYYSWTDDSDFDDGDGALSQDEFGANILLPLALRDSWKLTSGLRYRWNELGFGGRDLPFGDTQNLHRVELPFNLWVDYTDRWNIWLRTSPGIFSDFEDVDSDDFTFSALALASYKWTDSLTIAAGGYYSRDLGEATLLPAAGFVWTPDPHWSLGLTVPRVEIAYAPNKDWLIAARAYPSGGGWNISDVEGVDNADLNLSSIRAAIGIDRRVAGPAWAFADAGLQFAQELELDGAGRADFNEDLEDAWFLNVGLKLRF